MTETDDKLLKQFFGEQKQEIEDNGFSRRVILKKGIFKRKRGG